MNPFYVRLQVPLAIALVAAVRTAFCLFLTAGGLHVLYKVMLPSIRLVAFQALIPTRLFHWFKFVLAVVVARGVAAGA